MVRNYLMIAWKVFNRKKLFSTISLYGIVSPLIFIILIISFLTQIVNYNPPLSNGRRIFYLDLIQWKDYDSNGNLKRNMGNFPSYYFIEKNIKTMKTPKQVSAISVSNDPYYIYKNDKKKKLIVKYTDADFWEITDNRFLSGRSFNKKEFDEGQQYAILDKQTARFYFNSDNPVNQTIILNNRNYKVIGVIENVDVTKFRITGNVYLPITTNPVFRSKSIFTGHCFALIYANSVKDYNKINDEFKNVVAHFDYSEANGCNAMEAEIYKVTLSHELNYLLFFLFSIRTAGLYYFGVFLTVLLFLILPSLNLININLSRINERMSEIGVRKAFGASRVRLLFQILTETLFVTLAGAIIAIILTEIILFLINSSSLFPGTQFAINILAFILSVLIILAFGILSGIYPAWKMSRKKIINSLST